MSANNNNCLIMGKNIKLKNTGNILKYIKNTTSPSENNKKP